MEKKMNQFTYVYDPPFFLHKLTNYQKAVYERKGHWTEKEKIKYGVFLEIFRDKFEDKDNPILNKMFRVMSDFIKTRNHNQCRSHHQKMERERFQIDSILESIRSKYHPREYELFFEKYSRHVKTVNVDSVLNQKGFTPHKNVEKRKKNRLLDIQAKINTQEIQQKENTEAIKVSKIENFDPVSEVLKLMDDHIKPIEKNKIEIEKQVSSEKEIISKSKLENIEVSIIQNNGVQIQKNCQEKDQQAQKKTGLEYDSDSEIVDEKPKVAFFHDLPNIQSKPMLGPGMNLRVGMPHDFLNPMSSLPSAPSVAQLPSATFDHFPNFDAQFPSSYRPSVNNFGYEENYTVSLKDLEERKKWHLSEASRLCTEMNEHLQRANTCEQMKEMMMKQMMELRRGYFYPGGYASNQF